MNSASKVIVVIGGGFAGVNTARYLQKWLPRDWQIILFSQDNHLVFTPLLGDVVGSAINPMHVVSPIRQMIRRRWWGAATTCLTAEVTGLDLKERKVHYKTANGHPASQVYDHLVLACGSVVNLNIIPGMAAHGWPLKTVGDALALRNHIISLLEKAEVETDPVLKKRLLSVIVVGGGFSGVEVAGEISDLMTASCKFYTTFKPSDIHVTILEGRERILPELPESLSAFTHKKMSKRGLDIRLKAFAGSVTERGVRLKDGVEVEAGTVVCTIGTTVTPLIASSGLPLVYNRIKTTPELRGEGHDNVWALGDCAAVPNAYDNKPSPPTAQFALRQAKQLARNILRVVKGQAAQPFYFKPLGMFASIGNHKAVGLLLVLGLSLKVSGFLAWFMWRGIYLSKMPTFRRKIQIAFDWFWQLFFARDIAQLNLWQTERISRGHYDPGQFVFHKGEPGDKFYLIERGNAGVYLDESASPVTVLHAGDHFGEGALLRMGTRSASVKAEEPLDVLIVGRGSFAQLTRNMDILRTALERSVQKIEKSDEFLRIARDHPKLNSGRVRDVMSTPVATLPLGLTFGEALKRSQAAGKGAYPVVDDDGHMVGICTRTDFYNALQKLRPPQTPLCEIMHQPVITAREDDTLATALLTFLREPIKRVVVVADEDPARPVGMLTPFDILQVLTESDMPSTPGVLVGAK
jgi:NADH dehydrogenase